MFFHKAFSHVCNAKVLAKEEDRGIAGILGLPGCIVNESGTVNDLLIMSVRI